MITLLTVGLIVVIAAAMLACYLVGYRRGEEDTHAARNYFRKREQENWATIHDEVEQRR